MEKNNYILNTVDEIRNVLEQNEYRKKRYNYDIEWFQEKKKQIENNIIRIAIMGITSSGKSTLVNALLGEKILPVAIIPSSSIIITVSKGKIRQATVYFKDKEAKVLSGSNLNDKVIAEYADESKNPNNKFKVIQIDIQSPKFLLKDNIHIIDSPGLDACDLEIHEKLTLEILLPTIDICIFLTTVKANSDEINAEKIKIVHEKEKQIVLVQNMIDSIEEKIGKNGIIEEDKEKILKKHKKRGKNLLKSAINNNSEFDVIQISALNALKGRIANDINLYNSSNIEYLTKAINMCVQKVMPKINASRERSFSERINHIISTDREIIEGKNLENINSIKEISSDIDDIVYDFKVSREKIESKIKIIDKIILDTISEINDFDSEEVESYSEIIEKINNKNLKIEKQILNIVKECENSKKEIYTKLNLDIRYDYSLPSMEGKNIDVKHKYEERTRLIKKDGVFNIGKRLLSDIFETKWGYKEEEYDEKVVDKDATIDMVKNVSYQNRRKYMNILWEWGTQYNNSLNLFYHEISKKEEEYQRKKKQNIEFYDIDEVIKSLKYINRKLKEHKAYEDEIAITVSEDILNKDISKELTEYSISNVSYNLYKLINQILEKNYLLIGNYLKQSSLEKIKTEVQDIFWTWDIESCVKFVSRIKGIYLNEEENKNLKENGIYYSENIIIIYELCKNKEKFLEQLKELIEKSFNLFIMFNGIQIGNSEKQIMKSNNLNYIIENNDIIANLVIDSYKEFVNANNIKELLLSVSNLRNKISKKFPNIIKGNTLINSKNPIYNMALIEGNKNDDFIISDYKTIKEQLFANPLSRGKEEKETLEEILSYFLNK
ncbi:dynamin family protein [Clostridium weizhouense]|uniref:Dynamin family protein n=1 Tax=Clostridium weizhouense TaxID=2859781 RepID=A0ABS7APF3_9CLOT|nr:dynamin family protein [Clostridium weizhouense]MBW6410543.1 dynamin family protein [Clostridium weizhouense]